MQKKVYGDQAPSFSFFTKPNLYKARPVDKWCNSILFLYINNVKGITRVVTKTTDCFQLTMF